MVILITAAPNVLTTQQLRMDINDNNKINQKIFRREKGLWNSAKLR